MRELDSGIVNAANEQFGSYAMDFIRIIVDEDIPEGRLNITSAFRPVTFGGDTYLPMGNLLALSTLEHSRDVRTTPIVVTLSGLDDASIAAINANPIFGSKVSVFRGMWDLEGDDIIDEPYERWSGIITAHSTSIQENGTTTIQLTCKSLLEALLGTKGGRFTSLDSFQQEVPDDLSMEFVASLNNWRPNFGKEG